jgi:hypothetical protein
MQKLPEQWADGSPQSASTLQVMRHTAAQAE